MMTKKDLQYWAVGVVVVGAIIALLSWVLWLDSWNRLSPEEKRKVESKREAFVQDIDHCRIVTGARVIDFESSEFRRCATLLQDLDEQYREAAGSR
jgi:hypothetical protein